MNHLGLTYGHIAVAVFIVVSGFCLMLPAAARKDRLGKLQRYFARRCRRILPTYYACLLLSSLFILLVANKPTRTVWDNTLPLDFSAFFSHLFLVHNIPPFAAGAINYPLWSIAVEFQIYFLMPLIVVSLRKVGNLPTLAWTYGLGVGLYLLSKGKLEYAAPWYLGLFTCGCIAARIAIANPKSLHRPWLRRLNLWAGLGLIATLLLNGRDFYTAYRPYIDLIIGIMVSLLLCQTYADAEARRFFHTKLLSWKPLVAIGLFSYSLYLFHAPLLHAFWLLLNPLVKSNGAMMFGVMLAVTPVVVGCCYLLYRVFEKPFLATKPS